MEVLNPAFGEWLRARRRAFDLTQSELAERVGCAEDTIGRIEAGTRRPSKQVAALLADALGVPLQSQGDFVRFAREGGFSVGGLKPIYARAVIRVCIVPRVIVLIVRYSGLTTNLCWLTFGEKCTIGISYHYVKYCVRQQC